MTGLTGAVLLLAWTHVVVGGAGRRVSEPMRWISFFMFGSGVGFLVAEVLA